MAENMKFVELIQVAEVKNTAFLFLSDMGTCSIDNVDGMALTAIANTHM